MRVLSNILVYNLSQKGEKMKKCIIFVMIVFTISHLLFAEEKANYNDANGTIIFGKEDTDTKVVIRKCEVEVTIGDLATEEQKIIYDDYKTKRIIGQLNNNDKIKILRTYRIDYVNNPKSRWGSISGELWYEIKNNSSTGWICMSSDFIGLYTDPYYNNRWQIINLIQINEKKWTVRSMDQTLSVWENLNIRDNPGVTKTKVIYTIRPNDTDPYQSNVEIIAMTEEIEIIDGKNDHWLKVKYKDYIGWIFGGYATAERGGPKYHIPEYDIKFELGWY